MFLIPLKKSFYKLLCSGVIFCASFAAQAICVGTGCSCNVRTTPFSFGTYNPLSGKPNTSTTAITVTCSVVLVPAISVSYVIKLNAGSSGSYATRTLKQQGGGTFSLNYNLYTNAPFTSIWGDGTAGTSTISDSYTQTAFSVVRDYTVYGNLPASQNVGIGTYSDTITVTVTY